jgi:hypothetical protein
MNELMKTTSVILVILSYFFSGGDGWGWGVGGVDLGRRCPGNKIMIVSYD